MSAVSRMLRWLRTADAPIPRQVRAARRGVARVSARARHGSVRAHMEEVVRRANQATAGPSAPARLRPRQR